MTEVPRWPHEGELARRHSVYLENREETWQAFSQSLCHAEQRHPRGIVCSFLLLVSSLCFHSAGMGEPSPAYQGHHYVISGPEGLTVNARTQTLSLGLFQVSSLPPHERTRRLCVCASGGGGEEREGVDSGT